MRRESAATGAEARPAGLPRSPALARAGSVVAFAALTAAAARVALPLPGTPVPFTLQVAAVLLAGFVLGPRLGAASQTLYLAAGLAGLPVFAAGGGPAYLLGPTGGYLLAFPAAAAVTGLLAGGSGAARQAAAVVAGLLTIHLGGVAWLAVALGLEEGFHLGTEPFLAADLLKVVLVLLVGRRLTKPARRLLLR